MPDFKVADSKLFRVGGRTFVFLAESSAIFEVEDGVENALELGRKQKIFSLDTFGEGLNGSSEQKERRLAELLESRVLVNAATIVPLNTTVGMTIPLKTLVLQVTDACNLGCRYCYYAGRKAHHPPLMFMETRVAERAVDFLFEHSQNLEDVALVFFGGEPLMNGKLIATTLPYAREKAQKAGKNITFAITTNGTLLSEKYIRLLHENGVSITVSMDGYPQIHDRFRCFGDGSPSYHVIIPQIKQLLQAGKPKPVVARVTVAEEARDIAGILDHLLELGFSEAGFAPATTCDPKFQLNSAEMERLLDQFRELSRRFMEFAQKDTFLGFTNLIDLLVVLHEGEIKNYPCGAAQGLFAVDAQGRLFPCQRLIGDDAIIMGDIFQGFDCRKIDDFRTNTGTGPKAECKRCWIRNICAGGCYHEANIRKGSYFMPNHHYCRWIKDWVATGLEIYGSLIHECPNYLDKLSLLRGHAPLFRQIV